MKTPGITEKCHTMLCPGYPSRFSGIFAQNDVIFSFINKGTFLKVSLIVVCEVKYHCPIILRHCDVFLCLPARHKTTRKILVVVSLEGNRKHAQCFY